MATPLWSDNPSDLDLLGFTDVTRPIVEAVLRDKLDPVTVGIEGDWGSGKTTMLRVLAAELAEQNGVIVIETHPWEYDPSTDPKATLIAEVLAAIHAEVEAQEKLTDDLKKRFKGLAKRVRVSKALKLAVNSALSMGLPKIEEMLELFNDEAETVPDPTLQGFRDEFAELMEELGEIERVVVLVDDLDRCLPETVIASLEAVKLFLSVEKMAFVLAADRRAVAHAVSLQYEPAPQAAELGRQYLEKIIHIPVRVPALGQSDAQAYLALLLLERHVEGGVTIEPFIAHCSGRRAAGQADVLADLPTDALSEDAKTDLHLAAMLAPVLNQPLEGNPRRLKRFLNAYWMRATIAAARGINVEPHALAKLMVLEQLQDAAFAQLLSWLRQGVLPERLAGLEAGEAAEGASEAVLETLKTWAAISPELSGLESLESYLALAATLRSEVGAQVGLPPEVKALVDGLVTTSRSEMQNTIRNDLPQASIEARVGAAHHLVGRLVANPNEQRRLAEPLGALAGEEDVAEAIAAALEDLAPDRVEAALVLALLPDGASPSLIARVEAWKNSDRLETKTAAIASKRLEELGAGG